MDFKTLIDNYIINGDDIDNTLPLYPLSSDDLSVPISHIIQHRITGDDIIANFVTNGIGAFNVDGSVWKRENNTAAWFRVLFVRDEITLGLFDIFDDSIVQSEWLTKIIRNARSNPSSRIRNICRYVNEQREMLSMDVTDNDVEDYLYWLSCHTSSPKSTFAALILVLMEPSYYDRIATEQQQFIRENPSLILI